MRLIINYIIGIIAMIFFAYVTSHLPQYSSTLFMGYFAVMMVILFLTTGKSATKMVSNIEQIKKSKKIMEIRKETVNKLRILDSNKLAQEMKGQALLSMFMFIPIIFIILIMIMPNLRENIITFFGALALKLGQIDEKTKLFAGYLGFYMIFYIFSISSMIITRLYQKKSGGMLLIPSTYYLSENGLILDERTPILFPLKDSEMTIDEQRKFVEIKTIISLGMGGKSKSRIRLYHPQPKQLYDALKNYLN